MCREISLSFVSTCIQTRNLHRMKPSCTWQLPMFSNGSTKFKCVLLSCPQRLLPSSEFFSSKNVSLFRHQHLFGRAVTFAEAVPKVAPSAMCTVQCSRFFCLCLVCTLLAALFVKRNILKKFLPSAQGPKSSFMVWLLDKWDLPQAHSQADQHSCAVGNQIGQACGRGRAQSFW